MRALLKDKFETDVVKTQGKQVKSRDKQELPEEKGEAQDRGLVD